jgi:hypothetical protein
MGIAMFLGCGPDLRTFAFRGTPAPVPFPTHSKYENREDTQKPYVPNLPYGKRFPLEFDFVSGGLSRAAH